MTSVGFTLFETPIGVCGIAWGERGLVGVALPAADEGETRSRMKKRHPDLAETAPPPKVRETIDAILGLLNGEKRTLQEIELDDAGVPDFHKRVYDLARAIPPGETLTYGQVAEKLNSPGAARAVGAALGANPWPIIVPCHRILGAGGKTGGFSGNTRSQASDPRSLWNGLTGGGIDEHVAARLLGGHLAKVERSHLSVALADQQKSAATQAGTSWLNHSERERCCDRCIHRVAALTEDLGASL